MSSKDYVLAAFLRDRLRVRFIKYTLLMAHILFDIGGTKMRVARKISNTEFSEPLKVETPKDGGEGVRVLFELAREVANGEAIEGVHGGIAAVLKGQQIINSSNLKGWIGTNFEDVARENHCPVAVKNDASVVGLGEAVFGAGKDGRIIVYITVSTGVGGARIINRKIDESVFGFEPGHQILSVEKGLTLEDMVSGRSFEERYQKKPYEVEEVRAWEDAAAILAVGIYNTIVHWSPDVVVLGGPMIIGEPAISLDLARKHLSEVPNIFNELPQVRQAELVDNGGLYGALVLSESQ